MSQGCIELQPADAAGIARVRICNPAKHNALNVAMWQQLRAAFEQLQHATQTLNDGYLVTIASDSIDGGGGCDTIIGDDGMVWGSLVLGNPTAGSQLVGASRETVNKALADFAHRGWLRLEGKSVLILEPERLARRAR